MMIDLPDLPQLPPIPYSIAAQIKWKSNNFKVAILNRILRGKLIWRVIQLINRRNKRLHRDRKFQQYSALYFKLLKSVAFVVRNIRRGKSNSTSNTNNTDRPFSPICQPQLPQNSTWIPSASFNNCWQFKWRINSRIWEANSISLSDQYLN